MIVSEDYKYKNIPFLVLEIPDKLTTVSKETILSSQGESCYIKPSSKASSALLVFNAIKKTASEVFTTFNDRKVFIYSSVRDSDDQKSLFIEYPLLPQIVTNHLKVINLDELYLLIADRGTEEVALALEYIKQQYAEDTLILKTNGDLPLYFYLTINCFVISFCKAVVFQIGEEKISLK